MFQALRTGFSIALLAVTFFHLPAYAQNTADKDSPPSAQIAMEKEAQAATAAAIAAVRAGPVEIKFDDQAVLAVPKGYGFVPAAEAARVMKSMGNSTGGGLLGLLLPDDETGGSWFVLANFEKSGYIKDDDAKNWNADELLTSLKEGTEEGNKERVARGIPEMEVVGWVEKPHYDAATQRLIWSASTQDKHATADGKKGVNYNTHAFGREGYISMNLVTSLDDVEARKPIAKTLLGALTFNEGKRYADFNSSTDKVAEYGLAALIGGIAAKKLGLLALGAAFFAKFAKIIAVAALALGGGLTKYFKGKRG
jgi:uncharacterized membrane-anchored protein